METPLPDFDERRIGCLFRHCRVLLFINVHVYASIGPAVKGRLTGKVPIILFAMAAVRIASGAVKGCAARLAGIEVPSFPDTESTFPELKARVAKTIAFLQSVDAAKIDGSEARKVTLKLGGKDETFLGQPYLFDFVIPNFYFHVTTAYAILRHNGVEIGKGDYLGS
jgi:hypothetical protein